jgi:hypothetical protein
MGCHLYPRISCIPQIRLPINRKGKRKGKEKKKDAPQMMHGQVGSDEVF